MKKQIIAAVMLLLFSVPAAAIQFSDTGAPPPGISAQGNGAKVQLSTGTTTTNDCVKYDANGNTIDAGAACGSGGSSNNTTVTPVTISGNTTLVLPSTGYSMQPLTMTAAATITIPQGQWAGQALKVIVCQNGTGGFTSTFAPIAGLTIVGTFPVFTTTASTCGDFSLQYSTTTNAYLTGSNPGPL
jgi:hypothetical protein